MRPNTTDGARALIGDEQPPPGRIQAEIAAIALCGDHLLERERARRFRHGEHRDAVVARFDTYRVRPVDATWMSAG